MLELSVEEKIIFLGSRLNPSNEDIASLEQLVTGGVEQVGYKKLIHLATRNGVAPLLYMNLKAIACVPEKVLSKLRNIYFYSISANLRKMSELLKILDLLKANGITAIPYKGAIASEIIFQNPALYYGVDIDILVRPSDLEAAKNIFSSSGYSYNREIENDMLSSHYHIAFHNGKHSVELHWNLVKRYFDIPPEFWWEDAFVEQFENREILSLSPEKYLMCTIFRLFSHMFNPLNFFVLISEISNKYYEKIDWLNFAVLVKKYRMKRLTSFTMKFLNDFLGTKIGNGIIDSNILGYGLFKPFIINALFREIDRPNLGKLLFLIMLDSPNDILGLLSGRVLPKEGEIRLRYRIPKGSKSIYLYYVLNPVLLPLMLLRKKLGRNS